MHIWNGWLSLPVLGSARELVLHLKSFSFPLSPVAFFFSCLLACAPPFKGWSALLWLGYQYVRHIWVILWFTQIRVLNKHYFYSLSTSTISMNREEQRAGWCTVLRVLTMLIQGHVIPIVQHLGVEVLQVTSGHWPSWLRCHSHWPVFLCNLFLVPMGCRRMPARI